MILQERLALPALRLTGILFNKVLKRILDQRIAMSLIELKKEIIDKVSAIEDEAILQEIFDLLRIESEIESVNKLTDQEKLAIEAGLKDIEEGRIVSSEKANELIRGWLKK